MEAYQGWIVVIEWDRRPIRDVLESFAYGSDAIVGFEERCVAIFEGGTEFSARLVEGRL